MNPKVLKRGSVWALCLLLVRCHHSYNDFAPSFAIKKYCMEYVELKLLK